MAQASALGRVDLGSTWFFHAPVPNDTNKDNIDFEAYLHRAAGAPVDVALEHARRLLKPGSRLLVLADATSVAAIPVERWPALSMHAEVRVLLLSDPLERDPPPARLPFRSGGHRVELDLAATGQREAWHDAFMSPLEAAMSQLPARGVSVQVLSSEAASDAWQLPWNRAA